MPWKTCQSLWGWFSSWRPVYKCCCCFHPWGTNQNPSPAEKGRRLQLQFQWAEIQSQVQSSAYLQKHVFLTGSQVQLVLVVIHTQVDDVGKQLFITMNHFQLLLQRLEDDPETEKTLKYTNTRSSLNKLLMYIIATDLSRKCITIFAKKHDQISLKTLSQYNI